MNWNHFILLLTGIYLAYYAINLLADLYLARKAPSITSDEDILYFSDDIQPELITYEEEPLPQAAPAKPASLPSSPVESTGAVSLKELMRLAQNNLVEHTRAISY